MKIKGDFKEKGFSTSLRTTPSDVKVQRRKSGSQLKTSANFWKELCSARKKEIRGLAHRWRGKWRGTACVIGSLVLRWVSLWNGRCLLDNNLEKSNVISISGQMQAREVARPLLTRGTPIPYCIPFPFPFPFPSSATMLPSLLPLSSLEVQSIFLDFICGKVSNFVCHRAHSFPLSQCQIRNMASRVTRGQIPKC